MIQHCTICNAPLIDTSTGPVMYHEPDCPHAGSTNRNKTKGEDTRLAAARKAQLQQQTT